MITDELKKILADYVVILVNGGNIGSGSIPAGYARVGLGGNSTSPAALSLDVDTGVTPNVTIEKSNENVIQLFVEVLGSSIQGEVIREMGFFTNAGKLLGRVNFDGVGPFSTTEKLQLYLTLEVE